MSKSVYEKRYKALFANMIDGFIHLKYEENEGYFDFVIEEINPAFCSMISKSCEKISGQRISGLLDEIGVRVEDLFPALKEVVFSLNKQRLEIFSELRGRWFSLLVYSAQPGYVALIVSDITTRKKLEEKDEMMSWRDSLTNLFNRRYFEHIMRKYDEDLFSVVTVFSIDLDGLKMVNDLLGHVSGDELLISFSEILRKSFRKDDIVARVGGDEFAAVIANSDIIVINGILTRIQELIVEHNASGEGHPLSISIGYAHKKDCSSNMISVYNEADKKMYNDKKSQAGKRRVGLIDLMMTKMHLKLGIEKDKVAYFEMLMLELSKGEGLNKHEMDRLLQLIRYFDIGKVAVRDEILLKQDHLTNEERDEFNRYIEAGYRLAATMADLMPVAELILRQHENWDGSGYPSGLSAETIPIQCRIFRIIEAFIAMISDRPYRKAMDKKSAMAELNNGAGTIFDPRLIEKFARIV